MARTSDIVDAVAFLGSTASGVARELAPERFSDDLNALAVHAEHVLVDFERSLV
ncbi:hypothetical protein [Roseobacter weihaiensis]|uniref:hypothetical protein n=1 Tax=Roseobacter weihaiensis TaxID=2763262 RepID=UPI0038730D58